MERILIIIISLAFATLTGITVGDLIETTFNNFNGVFNG